MANCTVLFWIADDGKAVRFFVINRQPDKLSLAAVFDACLLCGDQGYVMEGNQVVCVGCGVHIVYSIYW